MAQTTAQQGASASMLDLSTEAPDRDFIRIDGQIVYLATKEDLSIEGHVLIERTIARFDRAQASGPADVTDDAMQQLAQDVRASAKAVLIDCPDDAFDKLKDGQLVAIIRVFSEAVGKKKAAAPTKNTRKRKAAGSK